MSSVGPQLPPHLAKRKRDSDSDDDSDDAGPAPPQKIRAASPEPAPKRVLGPSLPPSVSGPSSPPTTSKRLLGPCLPPSTAGPSSHPQTKPASPPAARRVLGPAPPPAPLSERPPEPPVEDADSDSSDDDYGPALPSATNGSAIDDSTPSNSASGGRFEDDPQEPAKPQRSEWMLLPPSADSWTSKIDPTKLKNRKFASGKAQKDVSASAGVSSIWTETPEQKRKRLEDQVLGRTSAIATSTNPTGPKLSEREQKEQAEKERKIREYNEKMRGKSLYETHAKKEGKEEDDDPSKRAFDREKDMAIGGRMDNGKKKEMLTQAKSFGSRFERGSFL